MKNKIHIDSCSSGPVDIHKLTRERILLEEKLQDCIRRMDYVGAGKAKAKINEFNRRLAIIENNHQVSMNAMLAEQPDDVRNNFRRSCTMIILLADLIYSSAVELQSSMRHLGSHTLNVMPPIKAIHDNSEALMRLFNTRTDEEHREKFEELSDTVYHLVMNRTMAFIQKTDKEDENSIRND